MAPAPTRGAPRLGLRGFRGAAVDRYISGVQSTAGGGAVSRECMRVVENTPRRIDPTGTAESAAVERRATRVAGEAPPRVAQPDSATDRLLGQTAAAASRSRADGSSPRPDPSGRGIPPGPWSFGDDRVLKELLALAPPGDRAAARDVRRALEPYRHMLRELQPRDDLPPQVEEAFGKYQVDGVPQIMAALLRGEVEAAKAEPWMWGWLGDSREDYLRQLVGIHTFATSIGVDRPKLVFHATSHQFEVGEELATFLSTTESPKDASAYLATADPTQKRRMVAFVLEGSAERPARVGVRTMKAWNEVLVPPEYQVSRKEQSGLGEVVYLRPLRAVSSQEFRTRLEAVVPEPSELTT